MANKYMIYDLRNDATHVVETREETIVLAEKLGVGKFSEVGADGNLVEVHVNVEGNWHLASEIARRQDAADRLDAFVRRVQNGLAQNEAETKQTPAERAEIEQAFNDFGTTFDTDIQRRAASSIEARKVAYMDIVLDAKRAKLGNIPKDDIAARLEELNAPEPHAVSQEVARQWARLDAQDFTKLQAFEDQENAAIIIAEVLRVNADYRQALEAEAPDVAAAVLAFDATNDRKVAEKDARKGNVLEEGKRFEDGMVAGVFVRSDLPVAVILWRPGESLPVVSLRRGEGEQVCQFTNDDVPAHDACEFFSSARVGLHVDVAGNYTGIEIYAEGVAQPAFVMGAIRPESELTDIQQEALSAFQKFRGSRWKAALRSCWMRADYPGMSPEHSAALQQLRNSFGPEWLNRYRASSPGLADASWKTGREAKTLDDAKALMGAVLKEFGLPEPVWRRSENSATPWEYAEVAIGAVGELSVGVSSGGVISFSGDPFTPSARDPNVTFERVKESLALRVKALCAIAADGFKADVVKALMDSLEGWGETSRRHEGALIGESMIVLDKHERAYSSVVSDGQPAVQLKLPGSDIIGVSLLSKADAECVRAHLASMWPDCAPYVVRDFRDYAQEKYIETLRLLNTLFAAEREVFVGPQHVVATRRLIDLVGDPGRQQGVPVVRNEATVVYQP